MNTLSEKDRRLAQIDQLVIAFRQVTRTILTYSDREIEVLRALNDRENVVKEQIKRSTIEHARAILDSCYRDVTGRSFSYDDASD